MSDRKLTKGNKYYSCQHQELAEKSCNTCSSGGTADIKWEWLKCSKCNKGNLGKKFIQNMSGGEEISYHIYNDCYQKDDKTHVCAKCHEKGKDNNERERESKFKLGLPN